jgi:hypothetical protein
MMEKKGTKLKLINFVPPDIFNLLVSASFFSTGNILIFYWG